MTVGEVKKILKGLDDELNIIAVDADEVSLMVDEGKDIYEDETVIYLSFTKY